MTAALASGSGLQYGAMELKQNYQRGLVVALCIAVSLHVAAIGSVWLYYNLKAEELDVGTTGGTVCPMPIKGEVDIQPELRIAPDQPVFQPGANVKAGIPNPVPDVPDAAHYQIPTRSEAPGLIAGPAGTGKTGRTEGRGVDGIGDGIGHRVIVEPFESIEQEPIVYHKVAPAYPAYARQTGLQGSIVVRILVDEAGLVEEAFVIRDSDLNVGFEDASLEAIRQWKFRPGIQNGNPVAVWMHIPIVFQVK